MRLFFEYRQLVPVYINLYNVRQKGYSQHNTKEHKWCRSENKIYFLLNSFKNWFK